MTCDLREKYKKVAPPGQKFKLSAGGESDVYYDFREMTDGDIGNVEDETSLAHKLGKVYANEHLLFGLKVRNRYARLNVVGMVTFGWRLVERAFEHPYWFDPHTDRCNAPDNGPYILVDDVLTTGSSCQRAFRFFGRRAEAIIVLVNRSGMPDLEGVSIIELLPEDKKI